MIRYSLVCSNGHGFDGWFRSSADFDGQAARGLLACPTCGDESVAKALMAPNVVTSDTRAAPPPEPAVVPQVPQPTPDAASDAPVPAVMNPMAAALATPEGQEFLGRLREIKSKLLTGSEDVGRRFAEEARKIHYGESEARPVHGQASAEEARALMEEGVDILPLPILPEERN